MPFRKWKVEPVFLSRKPIPPDKPVYESVTNGTLVKSLGQLASLLKIADRIFDEIGSECRLVFERTQRLKVKVQVCVDAVNKLDAKAVQVPVADLEIAKGLLRRPQYGTRYDQTSPLFLPSTRPPCVDEPYSTASATPAALMCRDGQANPQLFMVTPVLGDVLRKKKKNSMLDIETRRPASLSMAKDRYECCSISTEIGTLRQNSEPSVGGTGDRIRCRLPSPEEQLLATSLEYPSSYVPVDVTGSSFLRMMKLRRSLIHVDFVIKRKKNKKKPKRRHTVCEGNSKELEDAVKHIDVMNASSQTDRILETSSLSSSLRHSLSRRRGRATIESAHMEPDGLDVEPPKRTAKGLLSPLRDSNNVSENKENTVIRKKSTKPAIKSRSSHFNPISSLSAAFSSAVKMRQSSKTSVKQDDGRSSSGNWSASSSTRASVDSDQHHNISLADGNSNFPLGKDSMCDAIQINSIGLQDNVFIQKNSPLMESHLTVQKKDLKNQQCKYEADVSHRSNTSTPERASDSTNTSVALSPYLLRKGACSAHPSISNQDDGDSSVYSVDTDGYYTSMHTDSGLWNNIVQNLNIEENSICEDFNFSQKRGSQSSVSTVGNSSINSFLSRTATEISSNHSSLKRQKPVPQPPPRLSSSHPLPCENVYSDKENTSSEKDIENTEKLCSLVVHPASGSTSESDHETGDRIQTKTSINSSRYPSICAVSPETSEDEAVNTSQNRDKSPVTNIVVAEVHRAEKQSDHCVFQKNDSKSDVLEHLEKISASSDECIYNGSFINMYGNQSLPQSSFSSSLVGITSVPISFAINCNIERPITTFAPDSADLKKADMKGIDGDKADTLNELIVDNQRISKQNTSKTTEKSIPFKYAQKITVTPVARNEANCYSLETSASMSLSPKALKNHEINCAIRKPPICASASTLVSLEHSGSSSCNEKFALNNSKATNVLSPNSVLMVDQQERPVKIQMQFSKVPTLNEKAVARVTLDPTGKVIYRSNSLDRRKVFGNQSPSSICQKPLFATLPKYQGPISRFEMQNAIKTNNQDQLTSTSMFPIESSDSFVSGNKTDTHGNSNDMPVSLPSPLCQTKNSYFSAQQQYPRLCTSPTSQDIYFRPSRGGRFCRTYFPPHLISTPHATESSRFISSQPTLNPKKCENPEVQMHHKSNELARYSFTPEPSTKSNIFSESENTRHVYTSPSCTEKNAVFSQDMSNRYFKPVNNSKSVPSFAPHFKESFLEKHKDVDPPNCESKYGASSYNVSTPVTGKNLCNKAGIASTNFQGLTENSQDYCETVINPSRTAENLRTSQCDIKQLSFVSSQPPDVIPSSASQYSILDITSPTLSSSLLQKKQQYDDFPKTDWLNKQQLNDATPLKSLSPSELFAIIHNSKKRHNIKTESEKSLSPMSSRSSSPSIGLAPTKGIQVETGVFSKRSSRCLKPGDRHSWDSNRSFVSSKKSLAIDRFGKSKPTSMHDFKMLLLHARTGNEMSPRPSAAELLKVSPPRNSSDVKQTSRTLCFSPVKHNSHLSPQSSMLNAGHTTVPVKRSTRTRSPYLTRYDSAYPPILEDCLEESESISENLLSSSNLALEECRGKVHSDHVKNNQRLESNKPVVKATSTWV